MTVIRTTVCGGLAAGLVAAILWVRPAAGQTSTPPDPRTAAEDYINLRVKPVTQPAAPVPAYQAVVAQALPGTQYRTAQSHPEAASLARQIVKATREDEKRDLKKKLTDLLGRQFDDQAEKQQAELADLERQVADLKATLKKRHDNRDSIVDRRLEQMIQEAEGLGWSAPAAGPRAASTGFQTR